MNKLHIVIPVSIYDTSYSWGILFQAELSSLKQAGFDIHLHIFGNSDHIHSTISCLCNKISEYRINTGHKAVSLDIPFYAASRHNAGLLQALKKDQDPVLFYSTECASVILQKELPDKKILIRCPNVPSVKHVENLRFARGLAPKLYRLFERNLYRKYEKRIARSAVLLPVTIQDAVIYNKQFHCTTSHVPMLIPAQQVNCKKGRGNYCLYFGDFNDPEQEKCAHWLMRAIFTTNNLPFVITGKDPSRRLINSVQHHPQGCLVANPSENELQDLVAKSQIIIMPVFSHTGIKPEIYYALINGKHCIYYGPETGCQIIRDCCHIARHVVEIDEKIGELFEQPFLESDIQYRNNLINSPKIQSRINQFLNVLNR